MRKVQRRGLNFIKKIVWMEWRYKFFWVAFALTSVLAFGLGWILLSGAFDSYEIGSTVRPIVYSGSDSVVTMSSQTDTVMEVGSTSKGQFLVGGKILPLEKAERPAGMGAFTTSDYFKTKLVTMPAGTYPIEFKDDLGNRSYAEAIMRSEKSVTVQKSPSVKSRIFAELISFIVTCLALMLAAIVSAMLAGIFPYQVQARKLGTTTHTFSPHL